MYCGCPSISTSTPEVGSPPTPRIFIPPAAPAATPYPITPRPVMNSPGTCSVSTGSSDGSNRRSICRSSTTDTLIGRLRKFTAGRDPVTITSSIRTESAKRSGTALRAEIMPQHAIAAHR